MLRSLYDINCMKKRSSYNPGFTLLEVLITATLFVVVGMAVYATINNGIKIWHRLNKTYIEEDINIFFQKASADLRNSFIYKGIDFSGREDSLRFATLVTSVSSIPGLRTGPGEVIYYFNPKERKVIKEKRNLSDIYKQRRGFTQELLKDVESFRLEYYYYDCLSKEFFWIDEWAEEYLPLAVRIHLELIHEESPYEFTKTINVPLGQREQ